MAGKDWIQTFSGRRFAPLNPSADDVDIFDIAHALSRLCRFTGHVSGFYSVAEHSVRVSRWVWKQTHDPELALWGLLHDASEAYLNDISRPVKHQEALAPYRVAEKTLQTVICQRFDLSRIEPDVVRQADNDLLHAEAPRLFKGGLHPDWECPESPVTLDADLGWTPEDAELRFILEYRKLRREMR